MDFDTIADSWDAQSRSSSGASEAAKRYSRESSQVAVFMRRLAGMTLAKAEPLLDRFILYGDCATG